MHVCVFACVFLYLCAHPSTLMAQHGARAEHYFISASLGLFQRSSKKLDPAGNGLGAENRRNGGRKGIRVKQRVQKRRRNVGKGWNTWLTERKNKRNWERKQSGGLKRSSYWRRCSETCWESETKSKTAAVNTTLELQEKIPIRLSLYIWLPGILTRFFCFNVP